MLTTLVLLICCQAKADPDLEAFKRDAIKKEAEGTYKKIDWQKDAKTALEKARPGAKPVLVVIIVGQMGQKGAAEC